MMTLIALLVGSALAQTPPAPAPPPAPVQAQEDVTVKRVVADSDVFGVKNLDPTFDWSARESFLPRVIQSVEQRPF
jgi:hypothetical protein